MQNESLNQTLQRLIGVEGVAPEVATDKALDELTKSELICFVRPLVLQRARTFDRARTRHVERLAFGASTPDAATRLDARQELVRLRFPLPDGRYVPWGEATADDHLARAAWQRNLAGAVTVDAERHELAAHLIAKRRSASCLDDIPNWTRLIGDVA